MAHGTFNHKLFDIDGREKELQDYKVGDIVAIDRSISWPTDCMTMPADLAWAYGYSSWNGYVEGDDVYINDRRGNPEAIKRLNITFDKYFGARLSVKIKPFGDKKPAQYVKSAELAQALRQFGIHHKPDDFNSAMIRRMDKPTFIAFMKGYFTACARHSSTPHQTDIEVLFFNHDFGRFVQMALLRCGIVLTFIDVHHGRSILHQCFISGSQIGKFHEVFGRSYISNGPANYICQNKEVIPKSLLTKEEIDKITTYYRECDVVAVSSLKNKGVDVSRFQDIYFDRIAKIEYGEEKVYDVSVPNGHIYTAGGFNSHNSFLLAIYSLLRCLFVPKTKVVLCGAVFRQSKFIFEYMEGLFHSSPFFRSLLEKQTKDCIHKSTDKWTMKINTSTCTAIPIGDGSKIRGLRATDIIADEFNSMPVHVFETVIGGFGSVSASPDEGVRQAARRNALIREGLWDENQESAFRNRRSNKTILTGTCGYSFQPFYQYWDKHRRIIQSGGDFEKLKDLFPEGQPKDFDWRDFSIIRIPYEIIPEGFMDGKQVAKQKATISRSNYLAEYGACFITDSDGFFKSSLIQSCTATETKPVIVNDEEVYFDAVTAGHKKGKYFFGIDPASERDNFTIVIVEKHKTHWRTVYCWATNKSDFRRRQKSGLAKETDYFTFCARKIRDLMRLFPCEGMAIDAGGGGLQVYEALHDKTRMLDDEEFIWEVIDKDKPKDSDDNAGLHIVTLVQFSSAKWTAEANHGMLFDMESKRLLFPAINPITIALKSEEEGKGLESIDIDDMFETSIYDSYEDCIIQIEELKKELITIVHSRTGTGVQGRERWDTPEIKTEGMKKGHLRKDRYSALLMANYLARNYGKGLDTLDYNAANRLRNGGVQKKKKAGGIGDLYVGAQWIKKVNDGQVFRRVGG